MLDDACRDPDGPPDAQEVLENGSVTLRRASERLLERVRCAIFSDVRIPMSDRAVAQTSDHARKQ